MQINSISNVSFDGKIKYDCTLSESKKVFVEKILDYKKNGKTLRERITRSNFDVVVDSFEEKETLHPKLYFYSKFKKLRPTNHYEDAEKYTYFSKDLKIDSSIKNGAKHLIVQTDLLHLAVRERIITIFAIPLMVEWEKLLKDS